MMVLLTYSFTRLRSIFLSREFFYRYEKLTIYYDFQNFNFTYVICNCLSVTITSTFHTNDVVSIKRYELISFYTRFISLSWKFNIPDAFPLCNCPRTWFWALIKPHQYFSPRELRSQKWHALRGQCILHLLTPALPTTLARTYSRNVPLESASQGPKDLVQFKRTRGIPKSNKRNSPPRVRYQTSQRTRYFHQRRLVPESF